MNSNDKIARMITPTSFEDLEKYAKGNVVELPPFADDQPFYARLKRPSMINMMRTGKIPNELLNGANNLFIKDTAIQESIADAQQMNVYYEVIDQIVAEALVEPTIQQIHNAGLELTDEQLIYIFQYTQRGVKALNSFRTE